jgi:ATP-dependent protease ClpP protease subunit
MKEIRIDGVIGTDEGEVSAAWLRSELPENGTDPIRVSVHSEGGSVFEGFACHDVLAEYKGPKTIAVESTAFSIASFIAMAGDEIEMSPNAYFMLHNPRINIEGDDEELAKKSGMISSLKTTMVNGYAQRTGKSPDEIQAILKAETYFNATEAVSFGLADRITQKPVKGRVIARVESLPHGVATALFGVGSGGDNDSKKGKSMSESKPVAATVKEIKAAFPALAKAKPHFVIDCIEREMPLASVASAAAEEMMKENETLRAENEQLKTQCKAMEDEKASAKAEGDEEKPDAKAEGDDEPEKKEDAAAKARARGAKPVAKGTSGKPSASARWSQAIESALVKCKNNKPKAVALANRLNPGLREAMLAEVNAQ